MDHYLEIDIYCVAERERPFARVTSILSLQEKLTEMLNSMKLISLYEAVERPLIAVLADMEFIGIRVDRRSARICPCRKNLYFGGL